MVGLTGRAIGAAHQATRAFALVKKKRPSSEPKVGVAPIDGKTPSFRQPGCQFTGPWLYVPGSPQVCPFAEVVLLPHSLDQKKDVCQKNHNYFSVLYVLYGENPAVSQRVIYLFCSSRMLENFQMKDFENVFFV
jgi:hypothetical protein